MKQKINGAAAFFALVLFLSGVVIGILGNRYYMSNIVDAKTSDDWRKSYVGEMKTKLSLNQPQVDHLQVILDETKIKYRAVRDAYRPAMLEVRDEQVRRVKKILTPSQIPLYDQILAEREAKSKEQDARDRQKEQREFSDHASKLKR